MAKLYGLGNYLISELTTKLIAHKEFNKLVYYKDEKGDVLSMPDLDNPFQQLEGKIYQNRRPEKVLENQDICAFIWLDDIRNKNATTKKIKTATFNIGFIVNVNCSKISNGIREIALISAIEDAVETNEFQKALGGTVRVVRTVPLAGIPHEWNGYKVVVECDGFTDACKVYEVK